MEANELDKPYSKWEWFLYIILLPSLFTLILVGIILTFMKVDVITPILEVGNKIPFVEKIIPDPKGKADDDFVLYENTFGSQNNQIYNDLTSTSSTMDDISQYQVEIKNKEVLIAQLEAELKLADEQITQLEAEINELLINKEESIHAELNAKTKEIAQLYSEMTASKAAPILANIENEEVAQILAQMDNKTRAQILAKMEPLKAAELTLLLKQEPSNN